MKGLLKLSTVALSAAMVAGMSTPVFAAGANVGGTTTTATTIEVTDTNGNVVATTKANTKYYDFNGYDAANTDPDGKAETLTVSLNKGGVKTLSAVASDKSAVKWAYDTENKDDDALKAEKKAVTLDNGKITVTKDAPASASYDLLAYTDANLAKNADGKVTGELTGKYITVTVKVVSTTPTITFTNVDSTYTDTDNVNFASFADESTTEEKLPEVSHSTAELKNASKKVNHVTLGNSAAFTIDTKDDADYNTLVKPSNSKALKVTTTSGKLEGTVAVVGTVANKFGVTSFTANINGDNASDPLYVIADGATDTNVFRVYNPNSGEHFYTTSPKEVAGLETLGWQLEKIGWVAPSTGDDVYRLYNPNSGEHHYTTSAKERDALKAAGWNYEGVAFQSASKGYTPIYREYNKNAVAFNHNYTVNKVENDMLVAVGWKYEGVAFYALSGVTVPEGTSEEAYAQNAVDTALNA